MPCKSSSLSNKKYTYAYFCQDNIVCRLCWSITNSWNTVQAVENDSAIADKILEYIGIDITTGTPKTVCSDCLTEIDNFIDFKKLCQEAEERLKVILAKGSVQNVDDIELKSEDSCDNSITSNTEDSVLAFEKENRLDKLKLEKELPDFDLEPQKETSHNDKEQLKDETSDCAVEISNDSYDSEVEQEHESEEKQEDVTQDFEILQKNKESTNMRQEKEMSDNEVGKENELYDFEVEPEDVSQDFEVETEDVSQDFEVETEGESLHIKMKEQQNKSHEIKENAKKIHDMGLECSHIFNDDTLNSVPKNNTEEVCNDIHRYNCKHCCKSFKLRSNLMCHIKEYHEPKNKELTKEFKSKSCTEVFDTLEDLNKHIDSCERKQKYICDMCGGIFKFKRILERHMAIHTKTKLQCLHCDYSTVQKQLLEYHIRLHRGSPRELKPYLCDKCPFTSATNSTLVSHIKATHFGNKAIKKIMDASPPLRPVTYLSRRRMTTLEQLELLVAYMERHRGLALARQRNIEARANATRLWAELTDALNLKGPPRTAKEWGKVWNDYKCRIRQKLWKGVTDTGGGGGPSENVTLTPLEDRVSGMLGEDMGAL